MTEALAFTPEQFEKLLETVRKGSEAKSGLGAPSSASKSGLGCPGDTIDAGVYAMLAAGSPRLALAKAWGIPLAPYMINVRATFPDTDTIVVPDVGSDVKIVSEVLIDAMVVRIQNLGVTANQNVFQTQSDYYFNFQSGLEATLDVVGAPRYSVAPKYTPLSTIADVINGQSHWPGGWILTYQQQLEMSFKTTVTLPDAPMGVCCTFRAWTPVNDALSSDSMPNRTALKLLLDMGYSVPTGMIKAITGTSEL